MPFIQEPGSNLALDVAGCIQDRIRGIYAEKTGNRLDIISNEEALPFDDDFISKAESPNFHTLLHIYIENYLEADYSYASRKYEENFLPMAYLILDAYNIKYDKKPFTGRDSNYELYGKVTCAFRPLAHDVFCILFSNRELMRQFSRVVASVNKRTFKRATYWPTWLKDALKNRDHGRCGICSCDLTGLIALDQEIHIDHMVPISQNGTNDPTNLQILCGPCNLKKGNRNDDTSSVRHIPWKLE